jgi:hypothetical protein
MTRNKRRSGYVLAIFVASAALEIGASQARALWGMGGGMYGGMMGFNPVPQPGNFINQHALTRAAAGAKLPSRNVYANNSNSYINRVRDNGFTSHYSAGSRRQPSYAEVRRRPQGVSQTSNIQPPPAAGPDPAPAHPIGSFFNESRTLVWPSQAPVADDLKAKRDTSDQACLVVVDLVEKHRSAPITTVTDARQRLLDYGQPALRLLRTVTTPRVAESFHLFLLSLYESLAAAANPPANT